MRIRFLTLSILAILAIGFISYNVTHALFSDTAQSTDNTFAAAPIFPGSPGSVVINELMWMGSQGSPSDEWVELRNMTNNPIILDGWTLVNAGGDGSSPDDITLSGIIPGNGYWLLGNNNSASSAIANSIIVDQVTTDVELVNGGEQLILKNSGGTTIDATPVTSGSWPQGDNSPNQQSMSRNDPPSDGTLVGNWHTCTAVNCNDTIYWDVETNNYGTPKAANGL